MTPERKPTSSPIEADESPATVQLLVADAGNQSAIGDMLDEHFVVETSQTVTDADLYLIGDHLFPEYRTALRERVEQDDPVFCPIVLIRRERTNLRQSGGDPSPGDRAVPYDEVVDAPIDPPLLIRRLNSLLVRRHQSQELMQQVSTLEAREQRLRRFEKGVESTGNGVVMTDSEGTIEYVNPAFESIAGFAEDDVLGESLRILLPERTGRFFDEEFWRTMSDQAEWEEDIIIEGKDSRRLVVSATATALRDPENETEGFVIVLSDITERIQREQDLEAREAELDLLRQILTRYLRHNLRNHLSVIQGNAELLKEDETLSPEQIKVAETIIESSEDLIETSDTARDFSSVLKQNAELSPVDLSKITTNAVQTVRKSFPDVDFEIDVPESCEIRAPDDIQRAIEELIDNAARHNDATDPRVRIQGQDRDGARLVIEDNGPGISDQELDSLDRGTETQLSHSQGVGLWLSKWQIEGVDGQLSIEQIDSGTRVTVDFPPPDTVGSTGLEVATLKEREQRLQTITDRMTDAIIEVDADWNLTVVDGRAEAMLDIDADTAVGRSVWDVFSDLRDTQFETVVRKAMGSRSSPTVEGYVSAIDAWLEFSVYPEFDGGLSFYIRDITDRKERERDLQRIQKAVEALEHAIYITDPDGNIEYVNSGFEETTGFTQAEVVGETPRVLDAGEMSEEYFEDLWHTILSGEVWEEEIVNRRKNGETYTAMQTIAPVTDDGDIYAFVAIQNDITERKEREETLERRTQAIDQAPIGITIADPDLEDNPLIYVNDAFVALTGYSREETIGRNCRFLQGEDTDPDRVARIRKAIEANEPISIKLRNYRTDGTEFWNKLEIAPVRNDAGEVVNFIGFQQDVTERRERKRELELAEAVFQNTQDALVLVDVVDEQEYRLSRVNEAFEANTPYSTPNITGMTPQEILGDEVGGDIRSKFQECVASQKPIEFEQVVPVDNGSRVWQVQLTPLIRDGEVTQLVLSMRNITERKLQERKREQIIDRVTDAIVEVDADWRFTLVNEQAEDLYNMAEEDLLGRNFWEVFDEAEDTRFEEKYREVMETREPTSFVEYFSQLDGWFDSKVYPKDDGGIAFYFVEVTESKDREASLRDLNETTHRLMTAGSRERVSEVGVEAAATILGLDANAIHLYDDEQSALVPVTGTEAVSDLVGDLPTLTEGDSIAWRVYDTGEAIALEDVHDDPDVYNPETPVKSELLVPLGDHGILIAGSETPEAFDDQDTVVAEILADAITAALEQVEQTNQLRGREQALEQTNTLLSTLFETLPVGVTVLDTDGTIMRANQQAEEVLGLTESEITERTYDDSEWRIIDEEGNSIPGENLPFAGVMETGETIQDYEHGIKWPDGSERWLSINATPLTTSEGAVEQVVAVITDITDQRNQDQALKQQNEQLVQFASIVSHDLRNPLNVAEGRLELAREECDSEHLDDVDRALERMNVLIDDLLTLAREGDQVDELEPIDLGKLTENCWQNVATADATPTTDIDRRIQADQSRLQQLLENLIRNAVEHGGQDVTITVGGLEEGFYVEDDGPGIPKDERGEIFEAGYSTAKDGTGFGLSIVKQVAEAHGWEVRVTGGSEGGARFEISGVEFAAD